jgi:DNA-binding NtrC family response regulator
MKQLKDENFKLLIVDDEEAARYGMRRTLEKAGYEIEEACSADMARAKLAQYNADLVLLDVNMPGESGLVLLSELQNKGNAPLIVIITAHGSERMAVDVIKNGAYDYLAKPFEVDDLRLVVKNALETIRLKRENEALKQRIEIEGGYARTLIGNSEGMRRVRGLIEKVSETDVTVLIRGESGTGKELVAREIHERSSSRRKGNFVAINCAALPAELIESELFGHEKGAFTGAANRRHGKFEQANGGTLFLDEIGDMSANVQAKLLRALEERSVERLGGSESIAVDVRIISATHRSLEEEINNGNFRADLFYRLCVVMIEVPPLRERIEDVPTLANLFASQASERHKLSKRSIAPSALRSLMAYDWPGNVRQLRNVIERSVVLAEGEEITAKDLPEEIETKPKAKPKTGDDLENTDSLSIPFTTDFRLDRKEFEKRYISRCLDECGGNVTRAASMLGMHRQSLQHKLRELGLTRRYVSGE